MMKLLSTVLLSILTFVLKGQINCHLEKAIAKPPDIDNIINLEKRFSENDSTPAPQDSSWFEFLPGNKKILIVAGHATAQVREGKIKQADAGTGSLAEELNKLLDVPTLYTTYLSPSDPNFYDDNAFKDSLAKLVAQIKPVIVIDLHGSHPFRPYDLDFGTMHDKSYLSRSDLFERLKKILKDQGLINQSQDFFPAETNQTVTKFIYNKNIPCIQLEINSNYLSADAGNIYGQKTADLLQALIIFINSVNE